MTMPTRVCTGCRRRKPLADFYRHGSHDRSYRSKCKRCVCRAQRTRDRRRTTPRRPPGTFRCQYCDTEERQLCANQRTCHRLECRRAQRREQKERMRLKSATGICVDCGALAYFSRCEACRSRHQREVEASFCAPARSPTLCGLPTRQGACAHALSFGTDFLGRTTMVCNVHGETLMPVIGRHAYPQRVEFEDDLEASVERASLAPAEVENAALNGMHWRRESNAYVGDGHPWRQKKRSVA